MRANSINILKILLIILLLFLPLYSFAKPKVMAPPPEGKSWVWEEGHWKLIDESPPGPYEWKTGFWDYRKKQWVDGQWVPIKPRKGYVWIKGFYNSEEKSWIPGHWAFYNRKGQLVDINKPKGIVTPAPPPPGKQWVWVEGHYELVLAPPQGPSEWRSEYWNNQQNTWMPGAWVPIERPTLVNRLWISPHWDPRYRVWVPGHWVDTPSEAP